MIRVHHGKIFEKAADVIDDKLSGRKSGGRDNDY
jgi:hypothetical protein